MIFFANRIHRKDIVYLCIIAAASVAVRFFLFGFPAEVVFDETYYGRSGAGYITGGNTLTGHPPLGMLIIAAGSFLGDMSDPAIFERIGMPYATSGYLWLRLFPILAGILLSLVIYALSRLLRFSPEGSLLAALASVFENSLVVETRFGLIDGFLLLFGFGGFVLYLYSLRVRKCARILCAIFSGMFLAAAVAVKWSGLAFLLIVALIEGVRIAREASRSIFTDIKLAARRIFLQLVIPAAGVYILVFAVHFTILGTASPATFFRKTVDLHKEFIRWHFTVAPHPLSSTWFEWPLMVRPISYWTGKSAQGESAQIIFTGNLPVYLFSIAAILIAIFLAVRVIFAVSIRRRRFSRKEYTLLIIVLGYAVNFFPYAFIDRPMFLYHYLSALIFAILALTYWIERIGERRRKLAVGLGILTLTIFLLGFYYYSPFTYGFSVQKDVASARLWNPW